MATGHDIAMALRAAYWTLHRNTDAHLSRMGVTADQFVLLAAVVDLSERHGAGGVMSGVTQQDLVRRTASDPSTVRAMLLLLEGRGLVSRRRHPTDGRARSVSLTDKGRRLYERLWDGGQGIRDRVLAACAPADADALADALRRIAAAMSSPPDDARRTRPAPRETKGRPTRVARNT